MDAATSFSDHTASGLLRGGRANIDWSIRDDRFRCLAVRRVKLGQAETHAGDRPLAGQVADCTADIGTPRAGAGLDGRAAAGAGLYYLWVRQRDLVYGRAAMAWSSPVGIERA